MIDINGFESKVSQSSDVYGTTAGPISIRGGGETEREELPLNRFVRTVRCNSNCSSILFFLCCLPVILHLKCS